MEPVFQAYSPASSADPPGLSASSGYNGKMPTQSTQAPGPETIELKDPALAGFLAWLVPGLGHWYQGRKAKAAVYFVCIMGLFVYGLYLSSSSQKCASGSGTIGWGRAVYFSWRDGDRRLYYLAQLGVGLPALPALVQANRMGNHRRVFFDGFMAPPRLSAAQGNGDDPNFDQPTIDDLHLQLNRYLELATFFTAVAGLLNLLAIYDACAGPVFVPLTDKEEKKQTEDS